MPKALTLSTRKSVQKIVQNIGDRAATVSIRWMPDAFTFAVLMTLIVFMSAWMSTDQSSTEIITHWYGGFWDLLTFGMQMVLIVVTGYALATAPPVKRLLGKLAGKITSATGAVVFVTLLSGVVSYMHWGLGTILACFFAVEVAKSTKSRGIKCHFPLLIASAYSGTAIAMVGLSSSAALLMNTPGHFLEETVGLVPLTETIFKPRYIAIVVVTILAAPLLLAFLHPNKETTEEILDAQTGPLSEEEYSGDDTSPTPAEKIDSLPILAWVIGLAGMLFISRELASQGLLGIQLNVLNFFFLMAGLILHGSLKGYSKAISKGALAASGIILLFPFYGGILGIMKGSGLVELIATWFVSISTTGTYPVWTMISASIVNFAIPSAGGQWAVQGPIAVAAAQDLGLSIDVPAMAVMLGESLSNLAQPLWLVPLLGITGLRAGQVLGYTIVLMCLFFLIFAGGLLL